ncbi:MAG: hypothetical protein IKP65_04735 [Alphaproteobacteria bacterium]|nr:hypothetical protein [Alphaproteobacteria bacterium]
MENWNFCYYAVNQDNKLIYGFDDIEEAKFYAKTNHFKVIAHKNLKKINVDPENYDFWNDDFPEFNENDYKKENQCHIDK